MVEKTAYASQMSGAVTNAANMAMTPKRSVAHAFTKGTFDARALGGVSKVVLPTIAAPSSNVEDFGASSHDSKTFL